MVPLHSSLLHFFIENNALPVNEVPTSFLFENDEGTQLLKKISIQTKEERSTYGYSEYNAHQYMDYGMFYVNRLKNSHTVSSSHKEEEGVARRPAGKFETKECFTEVILTDNNLQAATIINYSFPDNKHTMLEIILPRRYLFEVHQLLRVNITILKLETFTHSIFGCEKDHVLIQNLMPFGNFLKFCGKLSSINVHPVSYFISNS